MIRQQLQQLSKSELIAPILQQQAPIEQLQARVAELEEQIKRLTQPPKACSNSSVPPGPARQDYPSTWNLNALPSPVATRTCGDSVFVTAGGTGGWVGQYTPRRSGPGGLQRGTPDDSVPEDRGRDV